MPRVEPALRRADRNRSGTGELALIERIRSRADAGRRRPSGVRLGIGDDCAILAPRAGHEVVVTTDMSLEGRHFRRDWHSPQAVGHRTLARGLSDLAAMGAAPLAAFLSLALPRSAAVNGRWVDGFLDGLLELATEHKVPLAGGDTGESPCDLIFADIVLLGSVPTGKALRRSGARVNDRIFCTGALGGAAAELASLTEARTSSGRRPARKRSAGEHPHLYPEPRIRVGQALVRRGLASACIDVSDGLSTDLRHLCEASGVAAEIEAEQLPIHALAQALGPAQALDAALNGGEDYELLFTAPPEIRMPRAIAGVAVTCLGRVVTASRSRPLMRLTDAGGRRRELEARGWEHLA